MIVTVSRAYGAAGAPVSRAAAAELGYRLVDDELDKIVATRLGASEAETASVEDRPRGFGERFLESLSGGMPESLQPASSREVGLDAQHARALVDAIRTEAERGDCVIVGRVAGAVLADRSDVLRVFVSAPLPWRIARVQASFNVSASVAKAEISRIDAARAAYAQEMFSNAWGLASSYHLTLDISRYGIDAAGALIAAAVRAAERV
jgi:cytidylate kinase